MLALGWLTRGLAMRSHMRAVDCLQQVVLLVQHKAGTKQTSRPWVPCCLLPSSAHLLSTCLLPCISLPPMKILIRPLSHACSSFLMRVAHSIPLYHALWPGTAEELKLAEAAAQLPQTLLGDTSTGLALNRATHAVAKPLWQQRTFTQASGSGSPMLSSIAPAPAWILKGDHTSGFSRLLRAI